MIDCNKIIFENDEMAIGKWEFWDQLDCIEQFNENTPSGKSASYDFKTIYLLPEGQGYWIFEAWSKGKLFIHYGGDDPVLCFPYQIKETQSGTFMLIFIDDENGKQINVLKKVSSKHFSLNDVKKVENINFPFIEDCRVLGKWRSIAYVDKIDNFECGNYDKSIRLWLEYIEFFANGKVVRKYFDCSWEDKWTKGKLLDQKKSVASNYIFKTINGKEYMFLEWKMGNYVYGGMPATYYVFEKY